MKAMNTSFVGGHLGVVASFCAQQQLRRSQFVTNTYLANPAVAGTESGTTLFSTYRQQWAGFAGGPTTMLLSGHRALPNGLGAGFVLYNDDMGEAIRQSGMELTARTACCSTTKTRCRLG